MVRACIFVLLHIYFILETFYTGTSPSERSSFLNKNGFSEKDLDALYHRLCDVVHGSFGIFPNIFRTFLLFIGFFDVRMAKLMKLISDDNKQNLRKKVIVFRGRVKRLVHGNIGGWGNNISACLNYIKQYQVDVS